MGHLAKTYPRMRFAGGIYFVCRNGLLYFADALVQKSWSSEKGALCTMAWEHSILLNHTLSERILLSRKHSQKKDEERKHIVLF